MKKHLLRIYKWILLCITLQVIVYLFINNIYLSSRSNLINNIKVIPEGGPDTTLAQSATPTRAATPTPTPDPGTPVPSNARDLKISYDKAYAAYIKDDKLEILDLKTKKPVKLISNTFKETNTSSNTSTAKIAAFKWLDDKNTILYTLTALSGAPAYIQIATYDLDSENEHTGVTLASNYLPYGSEAVDLTISSLQSVIYLKVKTSSTQSRYYRVNIMNEVTPSIYTTLNAEGKIGHYSETFIYQDNENRLFRKTSAFGAISQLPFKNRMQLLEIIGINSEGKDYVYVGELDEASKVINVLKGKVDAPPAEWTSTSLKTPLEPTSIFVTNNGAMYSVVENDRIVQNISTESKTTYKGKFISIVDGNVAYLEDGRIKFAQLK